MQIICAGCKKKLNLEKMFGVLHCPLCKALLPPTGDSPERGTLSDEPPPIPNKDGELKLIPPMRKASSHYKIPVHGRTERRNSGRSPLRRRSEGVNPVVVIAVVIVAIVLVVMLTRSPSAPAGTIAGQPPDVATPQKQNEVAVRGGVVAILADGTKVNINAVRVSFLPVSPRVQGLAARFNAANTKLRLIDQGLHTENDKIQSAVAAARNTNNGPSALEYLKKARGSCETAQRKATEGLTPAKELDVVIRELDAIATEKDSRFGLTSNDGQYSILAPAKSYFVYVNARGTDWSAQWLLQSDVQSSKSIDLNNQSGFVRCPETPLPLDDVVSAIQSLQAQQQRPATPVQPKMQRVTCGKCGGNGEVYTWSADCGSTMNAARAQLVADRLNQEILDAKTAFKNNEGTSSVIVTQDEYLRWAPVRLQDGSYTVVKDLRKVRCGNCGGAGTVLSRE